jgi:D-tagatose-1,6-bisphosphate aldolase subunit GatZ/KbaZ
LNVKYGPGGRINLDFTNDRKKHSTAGMSATDSLRNIVNQNRQQKSMGLFSVCSAHPWVLQAAIREARDDGSMLCVETTSNQVNQFGGYTGITPPQFVDHMRSLALRMRFPDERIILGADHLGPYPWRTETSRKALEKACALVRASVLAGYLKIHLDASMGCADDATGPLDDELVAERAAELCATAENTWTELPVGSPPLIYVIGTEVPLPGGEQSFGHGPEVTRVEHIQKTLDISRAAFLGRGLHEAWERVIGLVVQPGVEFGGASVFDYDRQKARPLSENLPNSPSLVYEAHSTDYQRPAALREMVEDHFAILKVGPWLTFALREAVFALSAIEREWLGSRRNVRLSQVEKALDAAMLRNPIHWQTYYSGEESDLQFARKYSYSDRCRYYWTEASVRDELEQLLTNLSASEIPLTLLSQYLPQQYEAVRSTSVQNRPDGLIEDRIRQVLRVYSSACRSH